MFNRVGLFFLWMFFFSPIIAGPILYHGSTSAQAVALTFDDGPLPGGTERLLAVLNQYHVRATFFVVGAQVMQHPDLVKLIVSGGHELANHSFSHLPLDEMTDLQIQLEISETNKCLSQLGQAAMYFRPPGGRYDARVLSIANYNGLKTIFWTVNGCDSESGDGRIVRFATSKVLSEYLVEHASSGGIYLLHNGSKLTLEALPFLIQSLTQKGYRFVTLSELFRVRS